MNTYKLGKFIVVDGVAGSGKSTILKLLKEELHSIWFTREPGGTPLAEDVRTVMMSENARYSDALTQFLLVWSARRDHIFQKIAPKIETGISVISDRFDSTTWAYQVHAQGGNDLNDYFKLIREKVLRNTKPDLYIFLDVSPEVSYERMNSRTRDNSHYHDQPLSFYEKVREGYKDFSRNFDNVVLVDASAPIEEVKEAVLSKINEVIQS